MEDVYPKFIIVDDVLIISKVTFHKEILLGTVNLETEKHRIKGGGWFKIKDGVMTFHGDSYDFGRASMEDIQKAINEGNVFTNIYQTHSIAADYKFAYDTGSEVIELK